MPSLDLPCACGASEYEAVLEGRFNRIGCVNYPFKVLRCVACGLHRTDPVPYDEDTVRDVYAAATGGGEGEALARHGLIDEEERAEYAAYAAAILDAIRPWASGGRLLDVGCSTGSLLAAAQARGFQVAGVEASETAARYAAQRTGSPVHVGLLDSAEFEPGSFNVVVLNHVLEHVLDPAATLSRLRRLLAPNGVLFLGQPNFASLLRKLYRVNWYGLSPRLHVWQFTPSTLAPLVRAAGFEVARVDTRHTMAYELEPSVKSAVKWALAKLAGSLASGDNLWLIGRAVQPTNLG